MSPNPPGFQRATAPEHRRAQAFLGDEQNESPPMARDRDGKLTLGFAPPLVLRTDDTLGIALDDSLGLIAGKLATIPTVGHGLELNGLEIRVKQGDRLTTLAEDAVTASVGYVQAEAQATMDKLDLIITRLRTTETIDKA